MPAYTRTHTSPSPSSPVVRRPAHSLPPRNWQGAAPAQDPVMPKWLWDMPLNTPEERLAQRRASMLWNCDQLHLRGRDDLAESMSRAWNLEWTPIIGNRQASKTVEMDFAAEAQVAPAGPSLLPPVPMPVAAPVPAPAVDQSEMESENYDPFEEDS